MTLSASSGRTSEDNTGGRGGSRAEAGLERPSSGATVGLGLWGLGGEEHGAEGDVEPVDARSAVCAGCAGNTALGVVGLEGFGGPLPVGPGARGRVGADLGGTAPVARRPKR